jgi:hypothetical protein
VILSPLEFPALSCLASETYGQIREVLLKGRLSTVDLLARSSLYQLLFKIENSIHVSYQTSYHNEEVNCTSPQLAFLVQIHENK